MINSMLFADFFRAILKNLILIGLIFNSAGCNRVDVTTYKGDGKIVPVGNNILNYGFEIYFDEIDLTKPFEKQYSIVGFPKIKPPYFFGLLVVSRETDILKYLKGELMLKVTTSNNRVIFECDSLMANWSDALSGDNNVANKHFLYFFEKDKISAFRLKDVPEPDIQRMTLHVRYEPKSTSERIHGTVLLRVGGYK